MSYTSLVASFGGQSLLDVPGLTVLATDPYKPPKRHLNLASIARSDTSKMGSAFYTEKNIGVTVGIARPTRALAEQSLDTLMGYLQGFEQLLLLSQGQDAAGRTLRQYYATYADYSIRQSGGSYIELELIFACSDRFGYEPDATQLLDVQSTSISNGWNLTFGGSAPWQAPIIRITYTSLTGANSTVLLTNNATGQVLLVGRSNWASGNVLVIDSRQQTVRVNGSDNNFIGAIPLFAPGTSSFSIVDNFTARNYTILITYNKRYI